MAAENTTTMPGGDKGPKQDPAVLAWQNWVEAQRHHLSIGMAYNERRVTDSDLAAAAHRLDQAEKLLSGTQPTTLGGTLCKADMALCTNHHSGQAPDDWSTMAAVAACRDMERLCGFFPFYPEYAAQQWVLHLRRQSSGAMLH